MTKSQVVANLVERRSNLVSELSQLRARVEALAADVAHIDATILLFDHEFNFDEIQPKGLPRTNPWFGNGELTRFALDALRQATGPLSTRQVGEIMATRKGVTPQTTDDWDRLLKSVLGALQRFERRSLVRMTKATVPGSQRHVMLWQSVS